MLDSLEAEPETGIQGTCLIKEVLPGEREWEVGWARESTEQVGGLLYS